MLLVEHKLVGLWDKIQTERLLLYDWLLVLAAGNVILRSDLNISKY